MNLVLHNYWRSSASYRVRIALGLKGLPWTYRAVNIVAPGGGEQSRPAFREHNPMAQVPLLEIDEAGQRRYLSQSLPIIEYLDDRGLGKPMLPADAYLRARARALAEIVNSGIQPLQNLSTTARVKALGGDDQAWVRHFIEHGLRAFAASCKDVHGAFCVGDEPTIADCALIPQLYSARRFGASLAGLDALLAIEARCQALPAFVQAAPEVQPDAPQPA